MESKASEPSERNYVSGTVILARDVKAATDTVKNAVSVIPHGLGRDILEAALNQLIIAYNSRIKAIQIENIQLSARLHAETIRHEICEKKLTEAEANAIIDKLAKKEQ